MRVLQCSKYGSGKKAVRGKGLVTQGQIRTESTAGGGASTFVRLCEDLPAPRCAAALFG